MSIPERYNLAYLCRFCQEIKYNQAKNKMSANALAICWAPTLIGNVYADGKGISKINVRINVRINVKINVEINAKTILLYFKYYNLKLLSKLILELM